MGGSLPFAIYFFLDFRHGEMARMAKKIAIFAIDFRHFRHFDIDFRHNGEHFLAIFAIMAKIFAILPSIFAIMAKMAEKFIVIFRHS